MKPDRRLGTGLDTFGNLRESWSHVLPVIESRLQRAGNVTDFGTAGKVAGDDNEPAISRGVFQRRKLHIPFLCQRMPDRSSLEAIT
jgi:hypothetical protein